MAKKQTDKVTWTSTMPERRDSDRRKSDNRRKMSGTNMVLKVPDLRHSDERRNTDRRETVKLTITGRAVEVSSSKGNS